MPSSSEVPHSPTERQGLDAIAPTRKIIRDCWLCLKQLMKLDDAVDDEAVDDEAVDDEAVDDEAVDDEAVDDEVVGEVVGEVVDEA
ncbi:uncharacterized protein N7518_009877 [Penicillium psychrosexuale]|uniref:uncharacterized protein n=1 Tax=Penicillium psychrosexuale TaxID=1002107 RepID=UPI0025456802|nr:uncharacterized protein N7518_009877 [Penicillium psychrosexuale]KAJ5781394.1 hypothetical protein N7518_009877 [Penicillium psychrosexuale]